MQACKQAHCVGSRGGRQTESSQARIRRQTPQGNQRHHQDQFDQRHAFARHSTAHHKISLASKTAGGHSDKTATGRIRRRLTTGDVSRRGSRRRNGIRGAGLTSSPAVRTPAPCAGRGSRGKKLYSAGLLPGNPPQRASRPIGNTCRCFLRDRYRPATGSSRVL